MMNFPKELFTLVKMVTRRLFCDTPLKVSPWCTLVYQYTRSPFRWIKTYNFRESPELELEQDKYALWPDKCTYINNRKDCGEKIQTTRVKTNNRWSVKMVAKEGNRTATNNKLPFSLENHGQGLIRLSPRAKLQMASEQGSLWLLESAQKYNIISYKIIHELLLHIKCK